MPAVRKLKPSVKGDRVAGRLCALVNDRYGGNLSTAAVAIGVTYGQLRKACLGHLVRGAPTGLLIKVAQHFDTTVDALTGGAGGRELGQ